ncbi:MAG: MFS transporter [Simkaniaceae bacterium]|nr:MFS transporter [Simkaniaceae bacterium]
MEKKRAGSLFAVYFVLFLDNFGWAIVFTIFAPLLLTGNYHFFGPGVTMGMRNLGFGVLFAIFSFFQLIGAPLIGDVADTCGRKKALYLTISGTTFGYILSAISIGIESYWLLLISRIITGFFAGNLSISMAAIADLSPTEACRGRNYGLVTTVCGVSWILAMLVGGYLSDSKIATFLNPSVPFWVTVALSLCNLLVVWKLFTETYVRREHHKFDLIKGLHNIREAIRVKETRLLYICYMTWAIGWGLIVQWFTPISLEKFHIPNIDVVWVLIMGGLFWSLGGSVVNTLLLKVFKTRIVALIGFTLTTLFLIASVFPSDYWVFGLIFGLIAFSASFAMSNSVNMISLNSHETIQGKALGLSQSVMSLGFFIGPLLGGMLANISILVLLPVSACIFVVGLIILLRYHSNIVE